MENIVNMDFILEETHKNPKIHLSLSENIFLFKGNSFSEDIIDVYENVLKWIDDELFELKQKAQFEFNYYVINSITSRCILEIVMKLVELRKKGKDITVLWKYDKKDDDILAIGEDIQQLCDIPFHLIGI